MIENGESLCRALLDNELDLALIEGGVEEADLTEEVFARDELVLILAPGHPLTEKKEVRLKDLMEYDLLLRERAAPAAPIWRACLKNRARSRSLFGKAPAPMRWLRR